MASATAHPATQLSVDDAQRLRFRKAMARKKRRDREAEGEIHELNLVAMMDLMTVILVFLLKSFSATTVAMSASEDIRPPVSSTRQTPKDTIAVTVTPKSIMVGEKKIVTLVNGELPADQLSGRLVVKLDQELRKEVDKLRYIEARGGSPFARELSVIGDRKIPYDLLLTVLYTAGQNELENYRFVVIQAEGKAPAE
jgi:biopolymer transport protein ExbD